MLQREKVTPNPSVGRSNSAKQLLSDRDGNRVNRLSAIDCAQWTGLSIERRFTGPEIIAKVPDIKDFWSETSSAKWTRKKVVGAELVGKEYLRTLTCEQRPMRVLIVHLANCEYKNISGYILYVHVTKREQGSSRHGAYCGETIEWPGEKRRVVDKKTGRKHWDPQCSNPVGGAVPSNATYGLHKGRNYSLTKDKERYKELGMDPSCWQSAVDFVANCDLARA